MRADLSGIDRWSHNVSTRCVVGDVLTRSARTFPDRAALSFNGRETNYRELEHRSNALAHELLEMAGGHQEPVAILMRNSDAFVIAFFACAKAGLVALPVNLAQHSSEIAYVLADSGSKVVVADSEFIEMLGELSQKLPEVHHIVVNSDDDLPHIAGVATSTLRQSARHAPEPPSVTIDDRDIVQCLYSSGTTSRPKGVLTSHVSVVVANLTMALTFGHKWGSSFSVMPISSPLFHTNALDALLLPLLATGGTAVIMDGFHPEAMHELIRDRKVTHLMMLPIQYQQLLGSVSSDEKYPSVRMCIYAMAPLAERWIDKLSRAFPQADIVLGSGMTECVPATVFQWPEHQKTKSGSWGPPTPTCEVAVMGDDGVLVDSGMSGEIVYRGPHVMHGYWNNEEANIAAFKHGWMHTGDIGHLDEDGVLWFTDRAKDVIKSGGENVSSVEVESVLLSHPGVSECAVIGLADERWGESVTALVVAEGQSELSLIDFCKANLAVFKVPKRIMFVDELPRTATGKVQKALLRERLDSSSG